MDQTAQAMVETFNAKSVSLLIFLICKYGFYFLVCFLLNISKMKMWFPVLVDQHNKCDQRYVSLHVRKSNRAALNLYTQALRFQ